MKIGFASDHAGYELKNNLMQFLVSYNYEIEDFGPFEGKKVDYPDFAHPLALALKKAEIDLGVLICGSGNGICMTANKHSGIRAALCWNTEIAQLAKEHNDANVLCLPARFVDQNQAKEILDVFLNCTFEGGRHQNRVEKINIHI